MQTAIRILAIIGAAISGWSLYEHVAITLGHTGSAFCHISASINCREVLLSPYATIAGVPLALWGLIYFWLYFVISWNGRPDRSIPPDLAVDTLFSLSLLACAASLVLFYISKILVGVLCPLCLGVYAINILSLCAAWFAGRSVPGHRRVARTVAALRKLIPCLFGPASEERTVLVRALGSLVIVMVVWFFMSWFLFQARSLVGPGQAGAVQAWHSQEKVDVGISLSGGPFGDYALGDAQAPIQVVEFSDFECPACRRTFHYLEPLFREYGDKVFFVFRNFPLDNNCNPVIQREFHRHACYAAEFARCAGEQGKFWEVTEYLNNLPDFDSQPDPKKVRQAIKRAVLVLGLDGEGLEQCLESGRQKARISADIRDGKRLNLKGTPSIWINGRFMPDLSEQALRAVFDSILKENQSTAGKK